MIFNLLVSYEWGMYRKAKEEIKNILKNLGDEEPLIRKTIARGICGVETKLNSREVTKKVRALYKKDYTKVQFAIKWVPLDNWCTSELEDMKKVIEKVKNKIKPGEKWAMEVEKRRYTKHHSAEIIEYLAKLIKKKVDLENPDKIVRIDILGGEAYITVLKPGEIFSTRE